MQNYPLRVTARALMVRNNKLLLVSNDAKLWYTPGGHLESGETLSACIIREVKEETGTHVTPT